MNHELDQLKHTKEVSRLIRIVCCKLLERADDHDNSKLKEPEASVFREYVPKLSKLTYGSEEYDQSLKEMQVALDHHYAHNRHHPEHHNNGINDMTLVDLVEMICDWKAATAKHEDGDIVKSIDHNVGRFHIMPQLERILRKTVEIDLF